MNIISIDPSLISTALIVGNTTNNNFKIYNYCRENDVIGKKGFKKWFKLAEEFIDYKYVEYRKFNNYSEGELIKLKDYDNITEIIINDIKDNINIEDKTKIAIEGYSYSSDTGSIIDLVTFSTILRKKLFDRISESIMVFSPSTLKLESCKLTYPPEVKEIGGKNPRKEYIWKNKDGVSGGKFTKTEMFLSIIENKKFNDYWYSHCKIVKDDILSISKIPKPYEDVCDAYLLYNIVKNFDF